MSEPIEKTHIFWTGGWDSTFRLIQLLRTSNAVVQPHYILRHEDSTGVEISAMIKIQREIIRQFPDVKLRLLPTKYIDGDLIKNNKNIDEQISNLRKTTKLNEQYRLMANYCWEKNIHEIEVSLDQTPGQSAQEWLDKHFKGASAFDSFTYPIFHLTKQDMLKIARENGWEEILFLTSFCRRPNVHVMPCGKCGPCVDAVYAGMSFRLPFIRRIKAKLQFPLRKLWRENYYKNQNNWFFKFFNKKFESKY